MYGPKVTKEPLLSSALVNIVHHIDTLAILFHFIPHYKGRVQAAGDGDELCGEGAEAGAGQPRRRRRGGRRGRLSKGRGEGIRRRRPRTPEGAQGNFVNLYMYMY